jgi:hypothetical protein
MIFNSSVLTAKKTPHLTVTKINRLTLFKEIIAVYCENHTKQMNTEKNQLLIVDAGGTLVCKQLTCQTLVSYLLQVKYLFYNKF